MDPNHVEDGSYYPSGNPFLSPSWGGWNQTRQDGDNDNDEDLIKLPTEDVPRAMYPNGSFPRKLKLGESPTPPPNPGKMPAEPGSGIGRTKLKEGLQAWVAQAEQVIVKYRKSVLQWSRTQNLECQKHKDSLQSEITLLKDVEAKQLSELEQRKASIVAETKKKVTAIQTKQSNAQKDTDDRITKAYQESEQWLKHRALQVSEAHKVIDDLSDKKDKSGIPAADLICPITLQLFQDPVIATDGHTYERKAIEQYWNTKGRPVSPKTNLQLKSRTLIPNLLVRSICSECIEETKNMAP